MAAGTSYSKRYAGGFADKPSTASPIDQTFLNAVETALLQLIGQAPSVDGQVAQWDSANTRFGPALILNKNVDPAAAIASSKIDFTGGNALTNAAIAGAAAIARSKLDFGSGLVNADIAAAAAIAASKLSGLVSVTNNLTVSGANTDLAYPGGSAAVAYMIVTTGGGTLRNIGVAPTGTRLILKCNSAATFTVLNGGGAGTGQQIFTSSGANILLSQGMTMEFISDGISGWVQVGGIGQPYSRFEIGAAVFPNGTTAVSFTRAFTSAPVVCITCANSAGVAAPIQTGSILNTGFTMFNGSGGNLPIHWIAVGF